jgi:hypothetical protein
MVGRAPGMGSPAAFGPGFVHEFGVLTMDQAAESPEFLRNDRQGRFLTRTHGGCQHGGARATLARQMAALQLRLRRDRVEQPPRGGGDLRHRALECLGVLARWHAIAADFADELEGRRGNFLVGGDGFWST